MEEIQEIKKDMAILFKWLSLQTKLAEATEHKNSAIRQQAFEKAGNYRKQETETLTELILVGRKLDNVAVKYLAD